MRSATAIAAALLIVLLGLHLVLRRLWAALVVFAAVMLIISPTGESSGYSAINIACSLVFIAITIWGLRFGLVGTLAMWFSVMTFANLPITANVAAQHFGIGLVGVIVVATLATFGAITATRRTKFRQLASL